MPKLIIEGVGEVNVESGMRLVLALSDITADNVHACGGFARCTTCQVEFVSGEPQQCTQAELDVLERKNKLGDFRLACQSPRQNRKRSEANARRSGHASRRQKCP